MPVIGVGALMSAVVGMWIAPVLGWCGADGLEPLPPPVGVLPPVVVPGPPEAVSTPAAWPALPRRLSMVLTAAPPSAPEERTLMVPTPGMLIGRPPLLPWVARSCWPFSEAR